MNGRGKTEAPKPAMTIPVCLHLCVGYMNVDIYKNSSCFILKTCALHFIDLSFRKRAQKVNKVSEKIIQGIQYFLMNTCVHHSHSTEYGLILDQELTVYHNYT